MLKKLSELPDERLSYYLDRVKEIASLGNEAALIETDKFIWELQEEHKIVVFRQPEGKAYAVDDEDEFDDEDDDEEWDVFTETEYSIKTLKDRVARRMRIPRNLAKSLYAIFSDEPDSRSDEMKKRDPERYATLIETGKEVAKIACETALLADLKDAEELPIANVHSVRKIIPLARELEAFAKKHRLLNGKVIADLRRIRVRAVGFRARKKENEAEIARVGGNITKADRLKKEAHAILRQDWAEWLPGEEFPKLES